MILAPEPESIIQKERVQAMLAKDMKTLVRLYIGMHPYIGRNLSAHAWIT
ncbi:MAG: hypothetical protein RR432_03040 [Alistipes sp.]